MSQLENAIAMVTLEDLIRRAKLHGLFGVAIWDINNTTNPKGPAYVAACLNKSAGISDPRSWSTAPTIEDAIAGLSSAMDAVWPERKPDQAGKITEQVLVAATVR